MASSKDYCTCVHKYATTVAYILVYTCNTNLIPKYSVLGRGKGRGPLDLKLGKHVPGHPVVALA